MRISPLDHCKVPSGLELSSKPDATGMSHDPLEKFSRWSRTVDFFVCCPIELRNAQRLAVIPGEVVEALEHGKLPLRSSSSGEGYMSAPQMSTHCPPGQ